MTVIYRWPLWTSGRYDRFYCTTIARNLTNVSCVPYLGDRLNANWRQHEATHHLSDLDVYVFPQ